MLFGPTIDVTCMISVCVSFSRMVPTVSASPRPFTWNAVAAVAELIAVEATM